MAEVSGEPEARGAEVAALAARVAALEAQVEALRATSVRRWSGAGERVQEPARVAPPPPRVADAAPLAVAAIPPRMPMQTEARERSLEDRLGSQIFNIVGVVAIIVAASWFLKLAIERGWIGPVPRVMVGLLAGAGVVLWSERFRRKGFLPFSYSLKAVGACVLYLSLWAAFRLYGLIPAAVALLAMVLVTAWNGYMAWAQDAELLAAYGLVGGFATPLLLSTGGDHETFLFTYVAALDVALVLLMRWKRWERLLLPGFLATAGYFIGWYSEYFHRNVRVAWDGQSSETALFALVFWCLFAAVSLRGFRVIETEKTDAMTQVLLPLGDAAFLSLALYSVMQDSELHADLAWLMVGLAAIYLGLMRMRATVLTRAIDLASAVVFLTIAIPLKASGHTLTAAWLVEGLVLLWAAQRFEGEARAPARMLQGLSIAGYTLGLLSLLFHWFVFADAGNFWNANLGSALLAEAVLGGAVWLGRQRTGDWGVVFPALLAMDLVAMLLTWREVAWGFTNGEHAAFANVEFATAVVGLALLAGITWAAYRIRQASVAAASMVLFNLLTILSVECEIGALWHRYDANLQRSLAISGFLMAYASGLLAVGFWKRSGFVRWQALLLLIFTICKVFFYDMSGLSQGYRVVSFLALGALLMGISFAYQKDWLGLRATAAVEDER